MKPIFCMEQIGEKWAVSIVEEGVTEILFRLESREKAFDIIRKLNLVVNKEKMRAREYLRVVRKLLSYAPREVREEIINIKLVKREL